MSVTPDKSALEKARECASNLRSLRASQEECYSLYEERDALKAEVAMRVEQFERAHAIITERVEKCSALERENSQLRKSVALYAEEASNCVAKLSASEADAAAWKSKAQKWEQDWGAARSKVFKLDAKVMALEAELERLKKGS